MSEDLERPINLKRAHTEYIIESTQSLFAIGFDFYEGEQNILLTLDGQSIASLGYTYHLRNSLQVEVTPPIERGLLRIQRETDIDQNKYKFTAGALFEARTMDANFEQVRQSQQEVRDGFSNLQKYVGDTIQDFSEQVAAVDVAFVEVREIADTANTNSSTALDTANAIADTANNALITSDRAEAKADVAVTTAESVDLKATAALSNSETALTAATSAKATAEAIDGKATSALETANNADTTATTALTQVEAAVTGKLSVLSNLSDLDDVAVARNNLEVLSALEVQSMLGILPYLPTPYPKGLPPTNHIAMMGQTLSADTHPILYALYGDKLPDMRAYTIRGLDYGRGIDVDRVVLSAQQDEIKAHTHSAAVQGWIAIQPTGSWTYRDAVAGQTGSTGGTETRVKNIAYLYIVKEG